MSRNWLEVLTMAEKYEILPVPTRILTVHDNIVDAIKEFGGSMIGPAMWSAWRKVSWLLPKIGPSVRKR